jgi:hypothetical protein
VGNFPIFRIDFDTVVLPAQLECGIGQPAEKEERPLACIRCDEEEQGGRVACASNPKPASSSFTASPVPDFNATIESLVTDIDAAQEGDSRQTQTGSSSARQVTCPPSKHGQKSC